MEAIFAPAVRDFDRITSLLCDLYPPGHGWPGAAQVTDDRERLRRTGLSQSDTRTAAHIRRGTGIRSGESLAHVNWRLTANLPKLICKHEKAAYAASRFYATCVALVRFESCLTCARHDSNVNLLPKQVQHRLWLLVRLSEHCRTTLNQHLILRELAHLFCHVCVADAAF